MFSLRPRDKTFFDLFERGAAIIVRAAEVFHQLTKDYANRNEQVAMNRQLEHDGDDIAHRTYEYLDRTFITPFDREDIGLLVQRMDDVLDEIDAAAKRMTLYEIPEPSPPLIEQTRVLVKACVLASQAIGRLRALKQEGMHDILVEIHQLENLGDDINHTAVADLFRKGGDPLMVMKWREIHDLVERAIDGCEDIANTIRSIMLKNA